MMLASEGFFATTPEAGLDKNARAISGNYFDECPVVKALLFGVTPGIKVYTFWALR